MSGAPALMMLAAAALALVACGAPPGDADDSGRADSARALSGDSMPTARGERTSPMPSIPHADSPRAGSARGPGTITLPPFPQRPDTTRRPPARGLPPEPSTRRPPR